MENETSPVDEELQSLAHLVTRQHAIVLCCAHSVAELVEEVARNLGGLGFDVEVVCGAEARSALLGRNDRRDEPTIYVVCVQGTLKEQVLKPLRQALATHGGPNQHLFVAVLDLALPLAMVGQIRRFAEALERPGGKGGGINERRQWREHVGPNGPDRVPTRAYRAVEVLERTTGSHPSVDATTTTRTGPQTVIGSARPTKVGVTAKYRAVTGQLPAVSGETESVPDASTSGRRRRKTHAPKVRVKPIAPARRRGRTEPPIEDDVAAAPLQSAASPSVEEDDPSAELRAPVPVADIEASMSASWGVEEDDTIVRTRGSDPIAPPPVPARTGDTVIAAAPTSEKPAEPQRRSETVLYTEAGDQPVLLPLPPPDPPSPTARGNTVIGQAPTRFRATPVAPVVGRTMIGITPPTVKRDESDDAATARGETVVAPPPVSPTARGDTAVGPPPSAPPPSSSPTARGETVVAPPPSSSPTAPVFTPPPSSSPTAPVFTPPPSPTARGETVVAPPRSSTAPPSATARGDTVFTPPPSSSPTARGETVVAPPRSSTAPPSTTARGDTVFLPPSSSPTARGDAAPPAARADTVVLPSTATSSDAHPSSSPTARGDTVVAPPPSAPSPAAARGNTVVPDASSPSVTVVPTPAEPKRGSTVVPTPTEPKRSTVVPEARARERAPIESIETPEAPQRSRWPIAVGILGVAAVGVLAWSMGWFGGRSSDATTKTAAIDPSASKTDRSAPSDAKDATPPAKVEPTTPPAKVEPATPPVEPTPSEPTPTKVEPQTPSEPATPPKVEPATPPSEPATPPVEPATPPVEPATPPVEPAAPTKVEPTAPPVEPATPSDPGGSAVEPGLTAAIAARRVRLTEHLYVATQRDEPTTYSDARAICRKLDVDGVTGWRLPYRRELTAADIAGWLRDEAYWSRTRPEDDTGSVFVIDTATGELKVQPKDELASVTCVKKR